MLGETAVVDELISLEIESFFKALDTLVSLYILKLSTPRALLPMYV